MFRPLPAVALSLAVAVAPAHAGDREDIVKLLGGIAALYLLTQALENRGEDQQRSAPVARAPVARAPVARSPIARDPVAIAPTPYASVRPMARPDREIRLIPEQCAVTLATDRGARSGYDAPCMQNAVARPGILPPQCLVRVPSQGEARVLYEGSCLADDGWSTRVARR